MLKFKTVVIIDDDDDTRLLLKYWLIQKKITKRVRDFSNVKDAVEFIHMLTDSSVNWPGLILLDLYMPGEKGLEFMEYVFSMTEARPKVFIVTGSENIQDVKEASVFNIDAYIKKPLTHKKLDNAYQLLSVPVKILN